MSDSERSTYGLGLLLQFIPVIALVIVLAPACALADSFLMLHNGGGFSPAHETKAQVTKQAVTVGLNENGDLTIRHNDLSLIMAYSPPNEVIDPQERLRIAQRQDSPAISGISLKVCLLF